MKQELIERDNRCLLKNISKLLPNTEAYMRRQRTILLNLLAQSGHMAEFFREKNEEHPIRFKLENIYSDGLVNGGFCSNSGTREAPVLQPSELFYKIIQFDDEVKETIPYFHFIPGSITKMPFIMSEGKYLFTVNANKEIIHRIEVDRILIMDMIGMYIRPVSPYVFALEYNGHAYIIPTSPVYEFLSSVNRLDNQQDYMNELVLEQ